MSSALLVDQPNALSALRTTFESENKGDSNDQVIGVTAETVCGLQTVVRHNNQSCPRARRMNDCAMAKSLGLCLVSVSGDSSPANPVVPFI